MAMASPFPTSFWDSDAVKQVLLAAALASAPLAAHAQAPTQSGPQQLSAFLASSLTAAMAENDALKAQVADLQKKLDAATKPAEAPK